MSEVNNKLALKATREELASIHKKMEDLENRSKRNNIVLWGLKEGVETAHNSFESFLKVEFFEKHMQLQNIEVMRAHRTNVSQRATAENPSPTRLIHIYLLRYSDKVQILKVAASALKDNLFLDSQMFISDDASKKEQSFVSIISGGLEKEMILNLLLYLGWYQHKFYSRRTTAQN